PLFDPARPANGWSVRGTVEFDFPPGETLAPQECLMIVGFDPRSDGVSLARFRSRYGFSGDRMIGPWRGRLSNSESVVQLMKPGEPEAGTSGGTVSAPEILVEQVAYSNQAPWPVNANSGAALSLQRLNTASF